MMFNIAEQKSLILRCHVQKDTNPKKIFFIEYGPFQPPGKKINTQKINMAPPNLLTKNSAHERSKMI